MNSSHLIHGRIIDLKRLTAKDPLLSQVRIGFTGFTDYIRQKQLSQSLETGSTLLLFIDLQNRFIE
jgi:hypothetical protein